MNPPVPPEPEPPEPTTPEYTYATATEFSLGAVTATYYTDVQYNGVSVDLTEQYGPSAHLMYKHFDDLVLYDDVLGDPQCYFATGSAAAFDGVLGDNSAMETTCPVYSVVGGEATYQHDGYLSECTPSDYYTNVKSRNFTLTQRS